MTKSPIALLKCVLDDLGTRCGTSTIRDLKTVTERFEHEGWSFLTITLPSFGEALQRALDQGFVGHDQFAGFRRTGGLPRFMGGFLDHVFDRKSGVLLDFPLPEAIHALRQFTLMFAKIERPCTAKRTRAAFGKFVQTEQDVRQFDGELPPRVMGEFIKMGSFLWADMLSRVDSRLYEEVPRPKHGPGATADGLRGNAKWNQTEWTERLEIVFPSWEAIIPSPAYLHRLDSVTILSPGTERPVKVTAVPKTLKTPRLIAIEPTCMQYVQQAVNDVIVEEIARAPFNTRGNDFPRGFVSAESQEPNQLLACEGSITQELATLDLSEASDRVSNQHVRGLLGPYRELRSLVEACRSRKADVPGFGEIRLAKFASMGSALCFPIESLVFATVVMLGIQRAHGSPLSKRDVRSLLGRVRVYGDDIIVPVDYVQPVMEELRAFGFVVNTAKSFWAGKFRESCGADFYDGYDVSVVRMRSELPSRRRHVRELVSTVSMRNQLAGSSLEMASTVRYLDELIAKIIPFPVVEPTSTLLGRHDKVGQQPTRYDYDLQLPLVKGARSSSQMPVSTLAGAGALMKWFLKRGDNPFENKDHLERAGRPKSARIKIGWAPPF